MRNPIHSNDRRSKQVQPKKAGRYSDFIVVLFLMAAAAMVSGTRSEAADLEAGAWPEFDIWIGLDPVQKNRIYILNSYAHEPQYSYEESALGVSWDQRFHPSWSWRAGIRYVWKEVDPPDAHELRAVFDLKWFKELGGDWLLTDRNRIDLRWYNNGSDPSWRYRNRIQIEKPFPIFSKTVTGFGSYEIYYDSRYDKWGQRHRFIAGVSVPIVDWLSVDVFFGYHIEKAPKDESGAALGIAFGIYFY